ncbi:hypothetical protein HZS55_08505 [Halosimplex rubrum]|uniref:Uncharacterized protein n=1 Tax=Halosimplex rubrum TaxID=869889 RepID=A0A7D5T403_9EURY|nr:hypothetical protein [Halosimplex rubrum]QLH77330.1 hypothetical protein HZS55_08505 [Halosimplex rubrum]
MDVDDALVRRATLAGWALLALAWFAVAVTDSTGGLAFAPADLAVGLALVLGGVGAVAVAATGAQARLLAGGLLVAGGTALVLSAVGVGWSPVETGTLSLVADLAILAALLLVLSNRAGDADDAAA